MRGLHGNAPEEEDATSSNREQPKLLLAGAPHTLRDFERFVVMEKGGLSMKVLENCWLVTRILESCFRWTGRRIDSGRTDEGVAE